MKRLLGLLLAMMVMMGGISCAVAENTNPIVSGIPLIIAPKPSTSSPLTKISRKSAIQTHCLHAK